MLSIFDLALVVHLVCDWLLQNEWMALNKTSLKHPAAYVHSGIHALGMMIVFPIPVAILIGLTHLIVDTRVPISWWSRLIRQTSSGPYDLHVKIWTDQVLHVSIIALFTLLT